MATKKTELTIRDRARLYSTIQLFKSWTLKPLTCQKLINCQSLQVLRNQILFLISFLLVCISYAWSSFMDHPELGVVQKSGD